MKEFLKTGGSPIFNRTTMQKVLRKNNSAIIVDFTVSPLKIKDDFRPASVLQSFLQQDASIISFNEILPSLNEIFIKKVEDTKVTRQFQKVS